jgi:hypothetical protein
MTIRTSFSPVRPEAERDDVASPAAPEGLVGARVLEEPPPTPGGVICCRFAARCERRRRMSRWRRKARRTRRRRKTKTPTTTPAICSGVRADEEPGERGGDDGSEVGAEEGVVAEVSIVSAVAEVVGVGPRVVEGALLDGGLEEELEGAGVLEDVAEGVASEVAPEDDKVEKTLVVPGGGMIDPVAPGGLGDRNVVGVRVCVRVVPGAGETKMVVVVKTVVMASGATVVVTKIVFVIVEVSSETNAVVVADAVSVVVSVPGCCAACRLRSPSLVCPGVVSCA